MMWEDILQSIEDKNLGFMQDECQLPKITRNGNVSSYGYKPFGDEITRTKTLKKICSSKI